MIKYLLAFILFQFQPGCFAQDEYVLIGSGGGFTGQTIKYKVQRDGTVLKGTGLVDVKFDNQSHIRKCEARKLFKKINTVLRQSFYHPGNMYYFIYHIKPGSELKCTWGETKFEVPEDLKTVYQETLQKLSKLEYNPLNK
jgi:hypothetical protein